MSSGQVPLPFSNAGLAELLLRARAGSPEALGQLLEHYRPYLLHVAQEELDSSVRAKEGPSDLVQRSFLEAARDFQGFRVGAAEDLRAWLRRILLHNIHDLRDRYQTDKRQLNREVAATTESSEAAPEPAADQTSPSGVAITREHARALDQALAKLDPDDRRLMTLRHQEGKSFAEIAAELDLTEMAARKRWARAVEELRTMMRGAEDHSATD